MLFQAEAVRRGLAVFAPIQSYPHVDCMVGSGGRVWRVQIKARNPVCDNGVMLYKFDRGTRSARYDATEIDVLAAYMAGSCQWAFFPSSILNGRHSVRLSVEPKRASLTDGQWRDWSIFTVPANSATLIHAEMEVTG
jgi:hypothetical protein